MNKFATNEARKPPRIGNLAIISGAVLGAVGAVGPSLSADLPDDYQPYRPTYYRNNYSNYDSGYSGNYDSGYRGCYNCSCCGPRPVRAEPPPGSEERPPFAVVERPAVERVPMAERHWVQRDYIERRYPSYTEATRYGYSPYPGRDQYSDYYPGPGAESYPAYEPAPYREPPAPYRERRRRFSYIGAHYPPVPAAYRYASEPRAPYRYAASSHHPYDYYRQSYEPEYNPAYQYKPAYEYEPSPRPPAAVPSYYGPGYSE